MSPSPIRCRGPWKIHKRISEPDRWLDEMGFFRKHTARDSSCLFRAVSENIFNTQRYFHKVRLDCVQFMASKRHLFEGSLSCPFENYLKEMSNPSEYGGLIEISAMSHCYRRDFVIFEANKGPQTKICNGYGDTIYLFYSPDSKHFDAVYTKEFINNSSFCQSLVYEILYDGVYQLKDLPYAVDKMLHDKIPYHKIPNHIEYFMSENVERRKKQKERAEIFIEPPSEEDKDKNNNTLALKCKHHTEDLERASLLKESLRIFVLNRSLIQLENVCMNCLNVNSAKDLLENGITPFPYKVAKALDPDIYRNIEFDVWSELRRELRYGARYCDGTTLQVGVKCLCKLQPEQSAAYHCHIQEMRPDGGPCLVFIEELGEKRVVNYEQLEPLPVDEIKPWAPPYRYTRANSQIVNISHMLQQIGNISRKQGLKTRNKSKGDDQKADSVKSSQSEEKCQPYPQTFAYPHLDYMNFQPMPVEVTALPLMVDCRPAAAQPNELAHSDAQHAQLVPSGDMVPPTPTVRASTPATSGTSYSPTYVNNGGVPAPGYAPYAGGAKSLLWYGSPPLPPLAAPHAPPPPPPHVNPNVYKSVQPSGADLPMHDIATLRFYFNVGVDCMRSAYGLPPAPPAHPPPAAHGPPPAHSSLVAVPAPPAPGAPAAPPAPSHSRHYTPRDLAQEMQQISLQDRDNNKYKQDKPPLMQQKPAQRPLLGPRFKRGGNNQEGNHNSSQNHHHNKGHNNNNNMPNKGTNNRRSSPRAPQFAPEDAEPPLVYPYIPYPPPVYPMQYYPVDSDPAMMGMMSGMGYMGYMGYEDGMEYVPVQHYYPPPNPQPQPQPQPQPHPHPDNK